jgi:hypothetical protein
VNCRRKRGRWILDRHDCNCVSRGEGKKFSVRGEWYRVEGRRISPLFSYNNLDRRRSRKTQSGTIFYALGSKPLYNIRGNMGFKNFSSQMKARREDLNRKKFKI